jgi:hypothetical protein
MSLYLFDIGKAYYKYEVHDFNQAREEELGCEQFGQFIWGICEGHGDANTNSRMMKRISSGIPFGKPAVFVMHTFPVARAMLVDKDFPCLTAASEFRVLQSKRPFFINHIQLPPV